MPRCENWKKVDLFSKTGEVQKTTKGRCSLCHQVDKMHLEQMPRMGKNRVRIVCPTCAGLEGSVEGSTVSLEA